MAVCVGGGRPGTVRLGWSLALGIGIGEKRELLKSLSEELDKVMTQLDDESHNLRLQRQRRRGGTSYYSSSSTLDSSTISKIWEIVVENWFMLFIAVLVLSVFFTARWTFRRRRKAIEERQKLLDLYPPLNLLYE